MDTNVLYYGDNLDILHGHIPDESVDLVYLDPPFNSRRQYNVLFRERSGTPSTAQIRAFSDTWHWDRKAEATYQNVIVKAPLQVSKAIEALREFIGLHRCDGLPGNDDCASGGVASGTEVHRLSLSTVRPYGKPLPQGHIGHYLWDR